LFSVLSDIKYNIKMVSLGSLVVEENLSKRQVIQGFMRWMNIFTLNIQLARKKLLLLMVVLIFSVPFKLTVSGQCRTTETIVSWMSRTSSNIYSSDQEWANYWLLGKFGCHKASDCWFMPRTLIKILQIC
jgi:hypothetical protein